MDNLLDACEDGMIRLCIRNIDSQEVLDNQFQESSMEYSEVLAEGRYRDQLHPYWYVFLRKLLD
jgi:hypothetical protein